MTMILIEVWGKHISGGETIKQRLDITIMSEASWMKDNRGQWGLWSTGEGVPRVQGSAILGSVDHYLYREKLATFLNVANGSDETTTAISSCDPHASKASLQTMISIEMSRERDVSHARGTSATGAHVDVSVMSRSKKTEMDGAGSPQT